MRAIKEVFLNFKRSGFLSLVSIGTIVITVTVLGGYYLINETINYFTDRLRDKIEIVVFLEDDISKDKIDNLITEIKEFPEITDVVFVSKMDAYQEFVKDAEMKQILDSFEGNPLPDSIKVRLKNYSKQNIEKFTKLFGGKEGVLEVQYGGKDVDNFLNIINVIKLITAVAGIIFIVASILVVSGIINLTIYARRHDIYVFRMVGATESYIRMPFIMEGIIHGIIGGLLGWGVIYMVVKILSMQIQKEIGINLFDFYLFKPDFFTIKFLIGCFILGAALGLIGSLLSRGRIKGEY
ncbi:MAG TPA: permease-like cell division protein FtsX [Candidatus Goldiibacteriota bacterium]|nr:permease-like cell division protein FtsX [Candidatus Goldiibacteriota bacterium]